MNHAFKTTTVAGVAALGLLAAPTAAVSAESLTIVSWGGAYSESQLKAYHQPYTEMTGTEIVNVSKSANGPAGVRAQVEAGNVTWDVVDMLEAPALKLCDEGAIEPIDHDKLLKPAPDGTPVADDFLPGSFTRCGVAHIVFSTVLAFDKRAFPGAQPYRVGHLFKPDLYPGKRALQKRPDAILEWALMSYGVPVADLYSLLSTERGLRLAFERLDRIRDRIVWWDTPAEAVELLTSDEVSFASGYNGRFFNARVVERKPVEIIWDAQLYQLEVWGIVKGARHRDWAQRFIRFATRTESLARQTRYIAYGPTRRSAVRRVGNHATTGVDMRVHMPTYPAHMERAIEKDVAWYARTRETLTERFDAWLSRGE